jgi:hypothetical protein
MRIPIVLIGCVCAAAAVVDRVAVVIGKTVLTESEVRMEVRLTEFLNKQPLDFSAEQRRAAAERLVDQQLIRDEMKVSNIAGVPASEADTILQNFIRNQYPDAARFRADLTKYGITEQDLKQHLAWQVAAIRFTDSRFQAPAPVVENEQAANRAQPGSDSSQTSSVDEQMGAWLKATRAQTRIQFKKEAFQ